MELDSTKIPPSMVGEYGSTKELPGTNKYCKRIKVPTMDEAKSETAKFLTQYKMDFSVGFDDIMFGITVYVLFCDDARLFWFPKSADPVFETLTSICFFMYLFELVVSCFALTDYLPEKRIKNFQVWKKFKGYLFSFYFWLDLLALLSLIPDIEWMARSSGVDFLFEESSDSETGELTAKASRVVRMIRLVRIIRLYKVATKKKRERRMMEEMEELVELGFRTEDELERMKQELTDDTKAQTKVGSELSELLTQRVIVGVLTILIVIPILSYDQLDYLPEYTAKVIKEAIDVESNNNYSDFVSSSTTIEFIDENLNKADEMFYLQICMDGKDPDTCETYIDISHNDLRDSETNHYIGNKKSGEVSIDLKYNWEIMSEDKAIFGALITIFVAFMLVTGSLTFTNDVQRLVLDPIDRMMEVVRKVANDPLGEHKQNKDNETEVEGNSSGSSGADYETRILESSILKITKLLRIGFGVAGAEIIAKNIAIENSDSGLDPMVPGKRVYCIFGFCDIHHFDLATERLSDEIMTFVNSIAHIVHTFVTRWGGQCNKNLGNCFLMVWRIGSDQEVLKATKGTGPSGTGMLTPSLTGTPKGFNRSSGGFSPKRNKIEVDLRRVPGLDITADKALVGFLKVSCELNRDQRIIDYRKDQRLYDNDVPFKVSMGFGMHVGWAIEGAVGSVKKVDATYLSPHVNMSARMETASRQYGVTVLMTGNFFQLMTSNAQSLCRRLDVVTVKGSEVPMPVYTYDSNLDQIFPDLKHSFKGFGIDEAVLEDKKELEKFLQAKADNYDPQTTWKNEPDLFLLKEKWSEQFYATFNKGIEQYLNGDWDKAYSLLESADNMMDGDGPSKTIMSYMNNRNRKCPEDWRGYRPLTSK